MREDRDHSEKMCIEGLEGQKRFNGERKGDLMKTKKEWLKREEVDQKNKSTFIKEHNKDNYKVISRDAIRFSLLKDNEDYFAHENEVYNIFVNTTKEELGKGNNVVADATFLNKNARVRFLRALGHSLEDTKVTAIMMKTPLDVCLERNEQREGRAYDSARPGRRLRAPKKRQGI